MTTLPSCAGTEGGTAAGWQSLLSLPPGARRGVNIHLIGIGGSGLSAIARLLLEMGYRVSGSDQAANEATADLAGRGAMVQIGHRAENAAGADLLLVSSAVPAANPEVQAARAAGIPVVKRADFLGPLLAGQHGVGVAGAHGKTTTTGMLAFILWQAGKDPSFIIGARLPGLGEDLDMGGSAARAGRGPFVIEADEYDRMFLGLRLKTAIVTNVEWDHVDCYSTPEAFAGAFREFVGQLPPGGDLIVCADDPGALALRSAAGPGVTVTTYGLADEAGWQARSLRPNGRGGLDAEVLRHGEPAARLALSVPGVHNVRNALAAIAAADLLGVKPERAAGILEGYQGAGRRFEVVGAAGGVTVIDDYGHHPTEVAATLAAARQRYGSRRIWAVFQPHTYSRFQGLLAQFATSFGDADRVVLLDIYASRERDELGAHSRQLLERLDPAKAHYAGSAEAAVEFLRERVGPGDVVITLSAGDGNRVGQLLLRALALPPCGGLTPNPSPEGRGEKGRVEEFVAEAERLGVQVTKGEPLARHTTFRIGGPAELFATAHESRELALLAGLAARFGLPVTILGGGSNVLIADAGIRGLVIVNNTRQVREAENGAERQGGAEVVAESGAALAGLARWCIREGWSGLEWAVSIPVTVGGAVIGNAGAHGGQIADNLAWAQVMRGPGDVAYLAAEDLGLAYRSSRFKEALLRGEMAPALLAAGFRLTRRPAREDQDEMNARAAEYLARRRATQPAEPSVGSIFRNPSGDYAGRLIEAAGLKGYRLGGAQVSPRHANFIINTGDARAADVRALMKLIQDKVFEQHGIRLIPEILLLGDWKPVVGKG